MEGGQSKKDRQAPWKQKEGRKEEDEGVRWDKLKEWKDETRGRKERKEGR